MITALPPAPLISGSGGVFTSTGLNLSFSQTATDVTITPENGSEITIPAATDTLAGMLDAVRAAVIDGLPGSYNDLMDLPDRTAVLSIIFDGGGAALAAGPMRYFYMPFQATITGWAICADQIGSITIDVWKEPSAGYPPTITNSITGGNSPAISSAAFAQSINLSGWASTAIDIGDVIAFKLAAAATCQFCAFQLFMTH